MAFKITILPFLSLFLVLLLSPAKGNIGNDTQPSAFGFIKHLQGCHKGSKVQGLHDLKLYLAHFGYLNYQHTPNHTNAEDHTFDEALETAVKSYQNFYHLNATGTLDEPTVSKMVMPRCGQPDKRTHQHQHEHEHEHEHGSKSFHTVSHFSFFNGYPRWPLGKTHLTYAFGLGYPNTYVPPVVRAFNKWSSGTGYFTFSKVDDIMGADLKISFERRDHGDGTSFDGPSGNLAHAFPPPDGRLHYNADYSWSDGPIPNAYDLETTALHEIGHLLGLDHSQDIQAIMWGISPPPGAAKGLNADDIQGIKTLYGLN